MDFSDRLRDIDRQRADQRREADSAPARQRAASVQIGPILQETASYLKTRNVPGRELYGHKLDDVALERRRLFRKPEQVVVKMEVPVRLGVCWQVPVALTGCWLTERGNLITVQSQGLGEQSGPVYIDDQFSRRPEDIIPLKSQPDAEWGFGTYVFQAETQTLPRRGTYGVWPDGRPAFISFCRIDGDSWLGYVLEDVMLRGIEFWTGLRS